MPALSIITVNYNNSEGLLKTFDSVFSQDFKDVEYLVIDGGSTDSSENIIKANEGRIAYFVSEKDEGIYHAMNKGIQKANGEYLMFLNSGDYLLNPGVLADAYDCIYKTRSDIYYGNIQLEEINGPGKSHSYPEKLTLDFWKHYTINHQAALIKATVFIELGKYEVGYRLAADYAFFLSCFVRGMRFEHLNQELVYYKMDGASSIQSGQYRNEMQKIWEQVLPDFLQELYKEHKAHNLLMKYRIMQFAKELNNQYKRLKNSFGKK